MGKFIQTVIKTKTFTVTECTNGFWLWDETREMNLSMRAKSMEAAFTEAIVYYQRRLHEVEEQQKTLRSRVEDFVSQFIDEDGEVEV